MIRWIGWVLAAIALVAGVVLAVPQQLGISGVWGVAQLVSFRGALATGFFVAALLSAALPGRRHRRAFGAVAMVAALVQIGILGQHGLFPSEPPEVADASRLVVVTLNTHGGDVPSQELADLAVIQHADVLAMPETSLDQAQEVAALLSARGVPMSAFGAQDKTLVDGQAKRYAWSSATSVLISDSLGTYALDPESIAPQTAFTVRPTSPGSPTISVVHPTVPYGPGSMSGWLEQTKDAVGRCQAGGNTIVAGDFNATIDHPAFADLSCLDAAKDAGAAGLGTYPAKLPAFLGTPIDHVLADPDSFSVAGVRVLEAPGKTDHRALVAVLERK